MKKHPNSANPMLQEFNDMVYRAFPPISDGHKGWRYGKLYFYADDNLSGNPSWMLDGMTPVGLPFALFVLHHAGVDTSTFQNKYDIARYLAPFETRNQG